MRILVLGGSGMLGHKLLEELSSAHEVKVTLRGPVEKYSSARRFTAQNAIFDVDISRMGSVERALDEFRPEFVVNAVGVIKQRRESSDAVVSIYANALFPHLLASRCERRGARLLHMSTDCVFSGKSGMYTEDSFPDTSSLYGRSKLLGELAFKNSVTLRTSIIGLELYQKSSLVEWYLAQHGSVRGFTRAIYSGLTTCEMAKVIGLLATEHVGVSGLYHVASAPISKFELLTKLSGMLDEMGAAVVPDDSVACDRSLGGGRFEKETGYRAPSWDSMLRDLAAEVRARGVTDGGH